jgi:exoribonuclease R
MKENIYLQIKQSSLTFFELYSSNESNFTSKQELGDLLRELENEKRIFSYKNNFYDLSSYSDVQGYVQWSMTGYCWLSSEDKSNDYGITFDPSENLLPIYNKRDAFYGSFVKGKDILIDDHHFIYVTEALLKKDINLIAVYNKDLNRWMTLNSNLNFSFKNKLQGEEEPSHNEVCTFKSNNSEYANLVDSLGNMDDKGIESKIIEKLAGLHQTTCESDQWPDVNNVEILNLPFYTIDSVYTKDIDDAIYIKKDGSDYLLYVAIADVSSYISPDSELDKIAQQSATSFYLPHKTIHMLERDLAENVCSLNVGMGNLALVCQMRFNEHGEMLSSEHKHVWMVSHSHLTYDDVNRMLEDQNPIESIFWDADLNMDESFSQESIETVRKNLTILKEFSLTQGHNQNKFEWLYPIPDYVLGEDGKIDHLKLDDEENSLSQKMVTSAMLAANTATAKFLYEHYPHLGIFRNQRTPEEGEQPRSASYHYNNEGHWGLNVDFYTHFTSPIRRYCDLVVHRLIKDVINHTNSYYDEKKLEDIVLQINKQHYVSKQCATKAKQLLLPQYFEHLIENKLFNEKVDVIDISANGLICQNKQFMEIFIPIFKMDKELSILIKEANDRIHVQDTVENRRKEIKEINKNWIFFAKIQNFNWTDTSKDIYFSTVKRKTPKLIP